MAFIKNIVIADYQACTAYAKGGTEIASFRIALALEKLGYKLFNIYWHGPSPGVLTPFSKVERIEPGQNFIPRIAAFLAENEIDLLVFMSSFRWITPLRKAVGSSGRKVFFLQMLHYVPGRETKEFRRGLLFDMIRIRPGKIDNYINFLIAPLLRWSKNIWLSERYRKALKQTDGIVLLSQSYVQEFLKIADKDCKDKFYVVPNFYNDSVSTGDVSLSQKEKRVLVLSRMDEKQKRISHILRIWKIIGEQPDLASWHLDIVGNGRYLDDYKKLARKLQLNNVAFHGWQDPAPFLARASVFAMTSLYEGLSLSLIEAMSFGCVPVVYGSYPSLPDVIVNGKNGFIIPGFGDIGKFAEKLELLMRDASLRHNMAVAARQSVRQKFNPEIIGRQWNSILTSL